jgi:pimeloyl-ACP methyl ester carboxylesterase
MDWSLPLDWERCGAGVDGECASLTVPLDYDNPDAGTIDLALARRRAQVSDERIGVLLYNPGGPGASGTHFLLDWPSDLFSRDLARRFDIVSWDPRGVSEGTEVFCGEESSLLSFLDPTPETVEEAEQIEEQYRDFVGACVEQSGHLLPHLSTVSTAGDMDLIREALGEEQISYLGQSYGAGLGAVYATLFPDRVRAAVLDGAFNFSGSDSEVPEVSAADNALQEALAQCAADTECPFHSGGDPFSAFDDLMESLDAEPLVVDDVEVGLPDALFAVRVDLRYEERWPDAMQTLADARDGDGSGMMGLRWMLTNDPSRTPLAIRCLDFPRQPAAEAAARVVQLPADTPRLARLQGHGLNICTLWPVEPDPPPPLTAAGAGPILAIGTTGDIATTLAMARNLVDGLEDGVLLVVERNAHVAYMPRIFNSANKDTQCVTSTVDNYLVNLITPANGSICTHGDPELKPAE